MQDVSFMIDGVWRGTYLLVLRVCEAKAEEVALRQTEVLEAVVQQELALRVPLRQGARAAAEDVTGRKAS